MKESTLIELEKLFLALADKTRLRLLALMADGEVPVGYLVDKLGESQPKISRHLAYLRSAGLVATRRDGKWVYYGIEDVNDAAVGRVLDATLGSILADNNEQNTPRTNARVETPRHNDFRDDISPETYMDDWRPADLEIFLL